jgi:FMN phosphatase YigB (HAD superfamily)
MHLTLLLDLDDTLLENDQNAFFAAFAATLTTWLSKYGPAEQIRRAMQRSIQAMFLNDDPAQTLAEAFYSAFVVEVPGADLGGVRADVDRYYREVYPGLANHTHPRAEAGALVEWAKSQGYDIVIASNPVFSIEGLAERLRWACLPPEKYLFALLTANESFHFVKSPAYYGEVMARLGWPDEPVLMVGDDLHLDVMAARAAGLPAYYVTDGKADGPDGKATRRGSIEDLRPWLETVDESLLAQALDSPEAILATLRSTPAGLAGLTAHIPPEAWALHPRKGEWGLTEILCHLRDVDAEVNFPRVEAVLAQQDPFIVAQDTDKWSEQRVYSQQDGREALAAFAASRRRLATALSGLRPEDWGRRARHSVFGPTDLRELAAITAEHDRSHIRQAYEALSQYQLRGA